MDPWWNRRLTHWMHWFTPLALAVAGFYPGSNPDTFGHLAQGRQIAQLGYVPRVDTWSLLPGPARPWHNYEWLSDLLFYGLYAGLGYDGLLAFKCLLLGATGYALLTFSRRLGGDRALILCALVILSAVPVMRIRFSDRPHVVGLCFAAFYFVLLSRLVDGAAPEERRLRGKIVAGIFVLHVLWVNIHGSHLLGVAITMAFCALSPAANRRTLVAVLALEAVASCISPYGPYIVTDAVKHVLDARYRGLVTEWMPWTDEDPPWLQLGPALQAAALTLVAPRLVRLSASARAGLLVAVLLGVASFRSMRFVAEFMLLTAPLIGAGYALMVESWSTRAFVTRTLVLFVALCIAVPWASSRLPPFRGLGHGIEYTERPHGPGVLLNQLGKQARVFGSTETNWYLMWEAPQARYVIDGRVPFYGPEYVTSIVRSFQSPEALNAVLLEQDLNTVVLKHTSARDQALIPLMQARPGWSLAWADDAFAFFVRDDVNQAPALPKFSHLQPGFASDWLLQATPEQRRLIANELAQLDDSSTARGYKHWGSAMLTMASFRFPGRAVGFRWPTTAEERAHYDQAARDLREAEEAAGNVPVVSSTQALVAAIRCDFATTERALDRADLFAAPGREAVLARQERALREGSTEEVAAFVSAAGKLEQGKDDPWLAQLELGLETPPSCEGFAR